MNVFADSLFALLFGWLRTLVQSIWSALSRGDFSGFFTWLGDHWLWVAAMVILFATAVDFAIWMIRWRPYLVWKTKFRRLVRFFRHGREDYQAQQRFHQGYREGVALEMPPADEPAAPWQEPAFAFSFSFDYEEPAPAPSAEPVYRQEAPQPRVQQAPLYQRSVYTPPSAMDVAASPEPAQQYFPRPQGYEPPPLNHSTRVHGGTTTDMPAARRKRRSDKYDKQKASWRQRLLEDTEDEAPLDGLPPAVDKEKAFHQPVYPNAAHQSYGDWQRPGAQNQGGNSLS